MDDLERLELEVERGMERLRSSMAVEVPPSVLCGARKAVRIGVGERFVDCYPNPVPHAGVLARVRDAVRARIADGRGMMLVSPRLWSPVAAAAMVLLCVGIIRQSAYLKPSVGLPSSLESFVTAGERVLGDDAFHASAESEIDSIEAALDSDDFGGDDEDSELRNIGDDGEDLFVDPPPLDGMSRLPTMAQGAFA